MSNTALNRTGVVLLVNKSGGSVTQGAVVIVDSANAGAFTTTTSAGYTSSQIGVVIEPNGIANNASGMVAFSGYVPVVNLSASASLGDFFKTHTVAGQAVRHGAPAVAGDFGEVLGTGATPAAILFGVAVQPSGTGDVVGPGSATDAHLAVFDGTTGKLIKDGGAVPTGGASYGQVVSYPTTFTGDTINGSSTTPFVDVSAFAVKEVLNSRILHLKQTDASKDERVRVTLGTTKAAAFDVSVCFAASCAHWATAYDTYAEVRLSDASDNQIAIVRLGGVAGSTAVNEVLEARFGGASAPAATGNYVPHVERGETITVRFVRDGSNVISFYYGIGTGPMALAQMLLTTNNTYYTQTVAGTLARVEIAAHSPTGPAAGQDIVDIWLDYLASV